MVSCREITSSDLGRFGAIVARLACLSPEEDVRKAVLEDVVGLMGADFGASYLWSAGRTQWNQVVSFNMDSSNVKRYDQWFQFRDPITKQLRLLQRASLVDEVIPRRELLQTEFFNDFLARDGLYHGLNMFVIEGDDYLGDFRIWRGKSRPEFAQRELTLLNSLEPFLKAALKLRLQLCRSLTPREIEVARLISRGCTDRDISRILGMSFGTVRTHLSRILEKKGCANRSELAGRFTKMDN